MSQAAVSIYAEVELRRTRLAQSIRQVQQDVQAGLRQISAQNLTVTVRAAIDPDLQRNLNTALSRLTVNPINVPVNFVPGNLPGGAGGGGAGGGGNNNGGGGAGGRANVGRFRDPFGAYGLARLLGGGLAAYGAIAAINLGTGIAEAANTASHSDRVLRSMDQLGARHGAYGDNFLSGQAQQIAGISGEQQLVHTIESVPLVGVLARFVDAVSGASHSLEDMKQNAEGVAEVHRYAIGQHDQATTEAAALTHDPLAIIDAKHDAERQAERSAKKTAGERLSDAQYKFGGMSPEAAQAEKALKDLYAAQDAKEANRQEERKQAVAAEGSRHDVSVGTTARDRAMLGVTGLEASGDSLGAMSARHKAEQDFTRKQYDARINSGSLSAKEKADLTAQRDAALATQKAAQDEESRRAGIGQGIQRRDVESEGQQAASRLNGDPDAARRAELATRQQNRYEQMKLTDAAGAEKYKTDVAPLESKELDRDIAATREKEAGDSAAKVEAIAKESDERITRARGEALAADLAQTKRATDERVAQLEREAKVEDGRDKKKAENLRNEAAAERTAGVERQRAIMIEQERESDRQTRVTAAAAAESELDAQGQHRAAQQKTIDDRLQEELKQIDQKYGSNPTDPKMAGLRNQAIANAQSRATTAAQGQTTRNRLSDRSLVIDTADADARSRGQAHVGDVLAMQAEFEDMERDAAGDPKRLALVRANEKARVAAMRRDLRPRSHTFGIEEYADALQSSISEGYRNNDAFGLLDALDKNGGKAAAGVNAPGGVNPADSLQQSAKDLSDAANTIKNARNLGVFRRGR